MPKFSKEELEAAMRQRSEEDPSYYALMTAFGLAQQMGSNLESRVDTLALVVDDVRNTVNDLAAKVFPEPTTEPIETSPQESSTDISARVESLAASVDEMQTAIESVRSDVMMLGGRND